jgi:Fe-S oxidoreductase
MSGVHVQPTEGCRFCWMCRHACPVGHVTARETYTPHAWALLIESVARGQIAWNRESVDVMYACADCGLCQAHCATDQPLPDAINTARVQLAAAGLAPAAIYELDRQWRARAETGSVAPRAAASAIVLYVGDVGPGAAQETVAVANRLLEAAGVSASTIGDGLPSGLLASTLGLQETATAAARRVVAEIAASGAAEVLVVSPGDRWTFEHVYPVRLGVEWPSDVAVREVVSVLADAQASGRLRIREVPEGPYAYHDPCHAPRTGTHRPAPRALLAAALGSADSRDLFFREHRAHPCGAVGGLDITHPAVAERLAAARFEDAARAGAGTLITEDPACLHHLGQSHGRSVAVKGLYDILADRLVAST